MKKIGFLNLLCLLLVFIVFGCNSSKTGGSDSENSKSDTDITDSVDDLANPDSGTDENISDMESDDCDAQPEISDCDSGPEPVFVRQPESMNIAPNNQSISLICKVKACGCDVNYQWYESSDGTTGSGKAVAGATDSNFKTPVFTEKGVHYYYCTASIAVSSGEVCDTVLVSDVASVAYTALPTLYINTPGKAEIVSKEEWMENSEISLVGAADESWNFDRFSTSIRGRGNSTWSKTRPKKPYALKLDKKQKIMGMPSHKHWVLLANYLDNSFMRNEVAFYLSRVFEFDWTAHGEFVDLVLNGEYRGLYWLGEAVKVDKNRVNINDGSKDMKDDEDKDFLIEMDVYYDEFVQFRSPVRDLPYMIKNDDFMVDEKNEITSGGTARLERFQAKINNLEKLLYPDWSEGMETNDCSSPDESYAEIIDIDSWVKFWFVNEIMDNRDSGHPRSSYFTFDSRNNVFKAGPVWDFDKSLFRETAYCWLKDTIYYDALFKSPAFTKRVKELWSEYYDRIDVEPVVESMRSKLDVSAEYDLMLWGHNDYTNMLLNKDFENFDGYVDYLKKRVDGKLSVVNSNIEEISVSRCDAVCGYEF